MVGGGQLARMMQQQAIALGIQLRVLVESDTAATAQVVPDSPVGMPAEQQLTDLIQGADVLTFEHEHVPGDVLRRLADVLPVRPSAQALIHAQDKLVMRQRLTELGVPCPRWRAVSNLRELLDAGTSFGWPVIVKTARGGYDGKGVLMLGQPGPEILAADGGAEGLGAGQGLGAGAGAEADPGFAQVNAWFAALKPGQQLLVEECVRFDRELAVLVARRPSGEARAWPVVETVQVGGVCKEVLAPAPGLSDAAATQLQDIGLQIATQLDVTGVLAVEMFWEKTASGEDRFLVNELAMRPHNSGHWTIEGAVTSQFEQHMRAVLDLPLGDTSLRAPTVMVNILGSSWEDPRDAYEQFMADFPSAKVHIYGKEVRPGRKLGHVTVCSTAGLAEAAQMARAAAEFLQDGPQISVVSAADAAT